MVFAPDIRDLKDHRRIHKKVICAARSGAAAIVFFQVKPELVNTGSSVYLKGKSAIGAGRAGRKGLPFSSIADLQADGHAGRWVSFARVKNMSADHGFASV